MKRLDGSDFLRDCSDDPRYFTVTSTSNTGVWDTVTGAETASRRCLIFGEQRRTSVDQAAGSSVRDRAVAGSYWRAEHMMKPSPPAVSTSS
jgi:hypothetical protein